MGIDAYIMFCRKDAVSRAEVADVLGRRADEVCWFGDGSFSFFTGIRFYEWENADQQKRVRLAFSSLPVGLFSKIKPFALAYPDVAWFSSEDTWRTVHASGAAIYVEFPDYAPGDPRLKAAAESEVRDIMKSVKALTAFTDYLGKDEVFRAEMTKIAEKGDVAGLIRRTRAVAGLAPLVDTLEAAGHFESFIRNI